MNAISFSLLMLGVLLALIGVQLLATGLLGELPEDHVGEYLTTEEQKARWLPDFCSGDNLCAIGMTEPEVGSVTPKACRRISPLAIFGSQSFFCSGLPCFNTVPMVYICAWQAAPLHPEA